MNFLRVVFGSLFFWCFLLYLSDKKELLCRPYLVFMGLAHSLKVCYRMEASLLNTIAWVGTSYEVYSTGEIYEYFYPFSVRRVE